MIPFGYNFLSHGINNPGKYQLTQNSIASSDVTKEQIKNSFKHI